MNCVINAISKNYLSKKSNEREMLVFWEKLKKLQRNNVCAVLIELDNFFQIFSELGLDSLNRVIMQLYNKLEEYCDYYQQNVYKNVRIIMRVYHLDSNGMYNVCWSVFIVMHFARTLIILF